RVTGPSSAVRTHLAHYISGVGHQGCPRTRAPTAYTRAGGHGEGGNQMSLVPPGKRGNKFWVWRERIAGKNYERSTGTLDKRVANRLVKQWREEALGAAMQTPGSLKTFSEVADLYI